VVVTSQRLKGDTVKSVFFSFFDFFLVTGELPDHEGLVSGTSDDDGGFFVFLEGVASSDASNPVSVTNKVTNPSELRYDFFAGHV